MSKPIKNLQIEIYAQKVLVTTDSTELFDRLAKDFSFFLIDRSDFNPDFKIEAYLRDMAELPIPSYPMVRKSKNSISYERSSIRYNDYFGKLISRYNYKTEEGKLYSLDLEKLHEITYLLILSRTGKALDLLGLHKIHAMGFVYKGVCCIGMMDMGVGKSTLLWELLKNPEVELLSDDTPIVSSSGELKAFPLRLGFNESPGENSYTLKRDKYGLKHLLSIEEISNPVGVRYEKVCLFEGMRGEMKIEPKSFFSSFLALQKHMVIGFGLPMILEYFWELGPVDFYKKTKIFFKRQLAAWKIAKLSHSLKFEMGPVPQDNAKMLLDYLKNQL